ncbi:hypothetical protein [Haloferax sp. DFSO52]|uniref:hypothetical protein n=1 Tax=Haloferax sp. DFSO52 TaxID=3388505 RepID=UPI003A844A44
MSAEHLSPGDEWPYHYRGYKLHTNVNDEVWWQLYNWTDRLYLDPVPTELLDTLLTLNIPGGSVRITESADVITKIHDEDTDEFIPIYLGTLSLDGSLVPKADPTVSVSVRPTGLSPGDLWPSVYDGAKYRFSDRDHFWWHDPESKLRHPVETVLPTDLIRELHWYKPEGGSFRITPWGDVITLILAHPTPQTVRDQFDDLPLVIRNIIKLRKERGVEMLPIYVGTLTDTPLKLGEPISLTTDLSPEEQSTLEGWAASLGATSSLSPDSHRVNSDDDADDDDFDDDPTDWGLE